MLKNILTITKRSLVRNGMYTAINVIGLSVGIAVFLTILTIIRYEYSFNTNHPDADRTFRMYSKFSGSIEGANRGVPSALVPFVLNEITVDADLVAFTNLSAEVTISEPNSDIKRLGRQRKMILASSNYFDFVGQHTWLAGSKEVLDQPLKVVLTKSQSDKYFGEISALEALGKTISYNDSLQVTVGGIVDDLTHSDFRFTDILSASTKDFSWLKPRFEKKYWGGVNSGTQLFMRASPNFERSQQENLLALINEKVAGEVTDKNWEISIALQPLSDLHFNHDLGIFDSSEYVAQKDILHTVLLVAIAILGIACINFINLMTAFAANRSLEIGVRKVMGSSRTQLIFQFLSESCVVTALAVVTAIPLVKLILGAFDLYIPGSVTFNIFDVATLGILVLTTFLVGITAGLYPSFILSSINLSRALKKQRTFFFKSNDGLRKVLTSAQFTLAQILIIGSSVAYLQVNYMLDKDTGLTKDPIFYFYTSFYDHKDQQQVFINKVKELPEILDLATFDNPPLQRGYNRSEFKGNNAFGETQELQCYIKYGDESYLDFFKIDLIEGKSFLPQNDAQVVVNETFAKKMAYSEDLKSMLGLSIRTSYDTFQVVGIFKDFHFQSLHSEINPLLIGYRAGNGVAVKFHHNSDLQIACNKVELAFHEVYPNREFNSFYSEDIQDEFYEGEKRIADLSIFATVVSILLSCLGLFGLASYTTIRRTKEIGIRKVMGATVSNIVKLLSSQFLRLVLSSCLIAIPAAYYIAHNWLDDFSYRISLSPWIFILSAVLTVFLTGVTVSYQSIRTARINPAHSLKYE